VDVLDKDKTHRGFLILLEKAMTNMLKLTCMAKRTRE
jgi:hypothetical protein